jgi:hypothetical protein
MLPLLRNAGIDLQKMPNAYPTPKMAVEKQGMDMR